MYFHSANDLHGIVEDMAKDILCAAQEGIRVRIDVDGAGNLRYKIGGGMWSPPFKSDPDPYRDTPRVKGMKWFVNEEGTPYDYPAEYQREAFPNDSHIPFDTEEDAQAASDQYGSALFN